MRRREVIAWLTVGLAVGVMIERATVGWPDWVVSVIIIQLGFAGALVWLRAEKRDVPSRGRDE